MLPRPISASEFKAKCLRILDDVQEGAEVVISKRGVPVARLVPAETGRRSLRGSWKGMVRVNGDIVVIDWTSEFEAAK